MGTFLSFLFFTCLVGLITYLKTRRNNLHSSKGYFLAGNSLNGWVIAGSLMLTNLSAANFTGMTANVYKGNLSPIAWTVTVIPVLIYFCSFLLPTFLKGGFTTIPEFLESRFSKSTQRIVAVMFLFSYIVSAMPVALYGGSIAINHLFNVPQAFGLSDEMAIWIVVWVLGSIGSVYALFGGLKGVAISDTLNGVGLLIGGALVFIIGVYQVGDHNFVEGAKTILTKNTEILDAVGDVSDGIPFSVLFTGMLIHNFFFWTTNQFIIQRTLGAKSLKEGQKGIMLASFFKVLNVFYIAFPGIIAFHLYGANNFENPDFVYPTLIRDIMPNFFVGFFAAVIFGTVLSTFNSVLNSSVTIFALDVYKPLFGKNRTDDEVIQRSKRIGLVMAIATMTIAPFIMYFPEGIFTFMVKVDSLFGAPILMALLLGYFSRRTPATIVNICLCVFVTVYGIMMFIIQPEMHYLHYMAMLFVFFISLALLLSRSSPATKPDFRTMTVEGLDLRPWKHFKLVSVIAMLVMIGAYVSFSSWGLVESEKPKIIEYEYIAMGLVIAVCVFGIPLFRKRVSSLG
ncbi:MAG: solute:sodium symporter family transporter [Opitutaceae bacterium]|nr:solute:sodium symporter family transporter [Opitutaceae bacterium]